MSIPETEKMRGHSLKGRKFTPNPVNKDNIAMENNIQIINMYTFFANLLLVSVFVVTIVNIPRKIKANPSTIHSIVIISLLSDDISPKSRTTPAVGNKWAVPHKRVSIPEK
jgi:hypothetical protein